MAVAHAAAAPLRVPLPVRWLVPVIRDLCSDACDSPLCIVDESPSRVTGYVDVTLTAGVTSRAGFVVTHGDRPATAVLEIRGMVWGEPVSSDDTDQAQAFADRIRRGVVEALGEHFRPDVEVTPLLLSRPHH
jgi:hypothetical protein